MYSKIQIIGEIEVITGMHIGGSMEFSAIGAVDNPVIKDSRTLVPMIPGSSLKGKMRTLLARSYNDNVFAQHSEDDIRIKRLFGSSVEKSSMPSRLIFDDMLLTDDSKNEILSSGAISVTEVKFENTINRSTGVANPRQTERVVRGTKFPLSIIYEAFKADEIEEDFRTLADGLKLLQYDYIGGHGSRGYGKVKFGNIQLSVIVGELDKSIVEKCEEYLKEV